MSGLEFITFISDWGWGGGYVAACEAAIVAIQSRARVIHISHEVPAGDVAAGALTLKRVAPHFPPAVHLAVVDPGVGTTRRALAVTSARGDSLVGPDNGLLVDAAEALGGLSGVWSLDPVRVRSAAGLALGPVSSTFHGRDVFAPAAAVLAATGDPAPLGLRVDPSGVVRLPPAYVETVGEIAVAEIVEIDRFGNAGLALRFEDLPPRGEAFRVEIVGEGLPEWEARVVQTFGELYPGELGLYCDSWGQAGLTLNAASAAELLSLDRGMRMRLTPVRLASAEGTTKGVLA